MVRRRTSTDPRSRTTAAAIRIVAMLGVAAAIQGALGAIAVIRGRTWVLNGPDTPMGVHMLDQVAWTRGDVDAVLTIVDLPAMTRVLAAVPALLVTGSLAIAALVAVTVLREIARGASFSAHARMGLGRISLTLIVGGVASAAADQAALVSLWRVLRPLQEQWVEQLRAEAPSVHLTGVPSIPVLVITLGVIAAAAMFALQDGATLEKEAAGVI
jgi:hypothetical protein